MVWIVGPRLGYIPLSHENLSLELIYRSSTESTVHLSVSTHTEVVVQQSLTVSNERSTEKTREMRMGRRGNEGRGIRGLCVLVCPYHLYIGGGPRGLPT